jgi:hypothetical protein
MEEGLKEIKELELRLKHSNAFLEQMELKDQILEIKRNLNLIVPPREGEACISCSG